MQGDSLPMRLSLGLLSHWLSPHRESELYGIQGVPMRLSLGLRTFSNAPSLSLSLSLQCPNAPMSLLFPMSLLSLSLSLFNSLSSLSLLYAPRSLLPMSLLSLVPPPLSLSPMSSPVSPSLSYVPSLSLSLPLSLSLLPQRRAVDVLCRRLRHCFRP